MRRAARALSGARPEVRRRAERHRRARLRSRTHARQDTRPGARRAGSAARRAHDDQGVLRRRGSADHVGRTHVQGPDRDEERARRRTLARRRRGALRQDERAALSRRLAELQRDLWHHEQPVGRDPGARRIVGRLRGRARGRAHRARGRQRHRLVDPQPRALLRRVRSQAHVGDRAASRAGTAVARRAGRHRRRRAARAQQRRSRAGALHHGRAGRDRGAGLAVEAEATAAEAPARLQGRADARRPRHRGGSRGAGPAADARRLSPPGEGESGRACAPGDRHR